MLNRLRTALVSSFVGAIALGWIFAQAVLHFAYIFAAPVASWLSRRQFQGVMENKMPTSFSVFEAIPEALKCGTLLIVGYLLLRWLYEKPLDVESNVDRQTGALG
jgi:hypothetical protein